MSIGMDIRTREQYDLFVTTSPTFRNLLLDHYLEWQRNRGSAAPIKAFAEYLGISETYFNLIWNGKRTPSADIIARIATKLADPRFYDVAGISRPDPVFTYVAREWPHLSHREQEAVRELIRKYRTRDGDETASA